MTDFGLAQGASDTRDADAIGDFVGSPPLHGPGAAERPRSRRSGCLRAGRDPLRPAAGARRSQGDSLVQVIHRMLHQDPPTTRAGINPTISPGPGADLLQVPWKMSRSGGIHRRNHLRMTCGDSWTDARSRRGRLVRPCELGYWCRRHPVQAVLGACLVLSIILGIRGLIWQSGRATHKGEIARRVNDFFFETILDALDPAESRANGNVTVGAIFDRAADPDRDARPHLARGRRERTMDHRHRLLATRRVRESGAPAPLRP